MFYVIYFSTEKNFHDIKKAIEEVLPQSTVSLESDLELIVVDDSFTLRVTNSGNNILFASEDYGCSFNYCFWFEIILSCQNWSSSLMEVTNKVLSFLSKELVLESNGERPFVFQDSSGVYIDSKFVEDEAFDFELICLDWKEKQLTRE